MNFIYKLVSYFKKPELEAPKLKQYELTDWFPTDVKPVHKGYYEVKSKTFISLFLMWDGKNWLYSDNTVCSVQERNWRGIKL